MKLSPIEQLNAIIGLSKRIEGWPSTLADLGYSLERIELQLKIPDRKRPGVSVEVTPDILFAAYERNYSLVVELKSGTHQGFDQLNKLLPITPKELVLYGRIGLRASDVTTHKISITEIINHDFLKEYLAEFQRLNYEATLISIDSKEIKSYHGDIKDVKLDKTFKNGIDIEKSRRPTRLIRVLPTTDDKYALTSSVVDAFKELWVNNEHSVTPQIISLRVFKQLWGAFDKWAQDSYFNYARKILTDMQRTEFNRYMRPVPAKNAEWKLLHTPEESDQRHRSRAIQSFQNLVAEYKWRARHERPYPKKLAAQPSFYDMEGILPSNEDDSSEEE